MSSGSVTPAPSGSSGLVARVADLLDMIKFGHTLFALPFALMGAILAARLPDGSVHAPWKVWVGILACMATARSAAMAFNRLVDRAIDARNPRTAARHLPAGRLSVGAVTIFTVFSALLFIAATLIFLPENPWPLRLSVPVLAWLLGYSYAKRFTSLAHFWLGVALMLSPIAAWIAVRGDLSWSPVLLGLAVLFWVAGFDMIYACQDADFDRNAGLRSIPARLGVPNALRLAALCHVAMLGCLVALSIVAGLGPIFQLGIVLAAGLLLYEHRLVRPDDLQRVNLAFFHVNVAISVGLLALTIVDLWVQSR